MLAAFVAMHLARQTHSRVPFDVIGDSQYAIRAIRLEAPVRSAELACLWDMIYSLTRPGDEFSWEARASNGVCDELAKTAAVARRMISFQAHTVDLEVVLKTTKALK
jgi:ribonuclease HI